MSVGFSTWIRIGGRIERDKIEPLLEAIQGAGVSLEWGGAPFEPKNADDLIQARGQWLWLCDDRAGYGEFPKLEATCRKLGLGYTRHCEAMLNYDAERVDFRPGMKKPLVRIGSNVNRETTYVAMKDVRRALKHLEACQRDKALATLRRICPHVLKLPSFEIV